MLEREKPKTDRHIHNSEQVPVPIQETWQALESLVITKDNPKGILRSIGVANFNAQLLYDVLRYAKISPAVNQIEHRKLGRPYKSTEVHMS